MGVSKTPGSGGIAVSCREHYLLKCLIDEISQGNFNDWEEKFIEDVDKRLKQGRELTDRQREKLEEIWGK